MEVFAATDVVKMAILLVNAHQMKKDVIIVVVLDMFKGTVQNLQKKDKKIIIVTDVKNLVILPVIVQQKCLVKYLVSHAIDAQKKGTWQKIVLWIRNVIHVQKRDILHEIALMNRNVINVVHQVILHVNAQLNELKKMLKLVGVEFFGYQRPSIGYSSDHEI